MIPDEERVNRYLNQNPEASPAQIAGAVGLDLEAVSAIVDGLDVNTDDTDTNTDDDGLTLAEHYDRFDELYSELGEIDDLHCGGNHDFVGWYNERGDRARMWSLAREYGGIKQRLDRTMYATHTYAPVSWFMDAFTGYEWGDNGRKWDGDTPTPDYSETHAYAPFADIDLADDVKQDRPDGEIPQSKIESALAQYAEAFADLAGDMGHVYALDSVGGAYMFIAPSATKPIADTLDASQRGLVFDDMMDKLNQWLADVDSDVLADHPELEGVFEADNVNNKNRLYKAPMSVHTSLDGVVTPVDPANPAYDYTPIESVTDAHVNDAVEWANGFTEDHTDAVESIVATLWPDHYAEAGDWQSAVEAVAEELKDAQEQHNETDGTEINTGEIPDDLETTDDIEVVNAVVEDIDVRDVAKQVADEYDTADRNGPKRFNPPWRGSSSGESCFVDRDKYVDLEEDHKGGGALKLVARADEDIDVTHSRQDVKGKDTYWKAINKLRGMGYEIPRFKGHDGRHADYLGLYDDAETDDEKQQQAAKALLQ